MAPGESSLARMAAMHRRFVLLLLCLVTALGGTGADSDDGPDPAALPCTDCDPDGGGGDGGVVYPTDEDGAPTSPSPWGDASSETSPAATTPGPTEPYAPAVEYTIRTGKINITVNGTRTSLRGLVNCGSRCRCSSHGGSGNGGHGGGASVPRCPDGVSLVRDGCNCCRMCARQQGDTCDSVQVCDARRQLHCVYPDRNASQGTCKVVQGQACQVEGGGQYKDGATFKLDCRTQCSCQNGTYGCVSLCPHEGVRPSAECRNARLVRLRGNCCREWLCDHDLLKQPRALARASCERRASEWGPCSATCGVGVSWRVVSDFHQDRCGTRNETRLCTVRPCGPETATAGTRHRTRRNHLCRATVRASCPQHYTDGANCTSVTQHTPKYCGSCPGRRCCFPALSTTLTLPFHCFEDGAWTTRTKDVMSIVRCRCKPEC
ncbi:CCN family member 2 [Ixodes scapularis]|uniref:CCN family member 2 n=1 Tax=Ixodes scapularis TaxID=6945 RepID=UPI001C389956|nr:CCN family member 2 [Ixodes scapularis]